MRARRTLSITDPATPRRLQRRRTRGWRADQVSTNPNGYAMITRDTPYGNPYVITVSQQDVGDNPVPLTENVLRNVERYMARDLFEIYAEDRHAHDASWLEPLRGKDLFCTCPAGKPCHGDVLIKLANQ